MRNGSRGGRSSRPCDQYEQEGGRAMHGELLLCLGKSREWRGLEGAYPLVGREPGVSNISDRWTR